MGLVDVVAICLGLVVMLIITCGKLLGDVAEQKRRTKELEERLERYWNAHRIAATQASETRCQANNLERRINMLERSRKIITGGLQQAAKG